MDVIIFLKAVSNMLFAAILLLAVVFTATFSIVVHIFKGITPALGNFIAPMFRRK